jgi:Lon protease-like protein
MTRVCIFPIPSCVTFPGTEFPLHVFEPRYRDMVHHCIETDMPVAICHTKKLVSAGKATDTVKEALSSNQATYRTFDVVSAGLCQLHETTADGRMYLSVHVDQRYRLIKEVQLLPYQVFECTPFIDTSPSDDERRDNNILRDKILHRLKAIALDDDVLQEIIASEDWMDMSAEAFSFQIFGSIRFDDDIQQNILEMDSVNKRLNLLLQLLNSN